MKLGFSNKLLEEKLKFQVSYLPNYQVEIKDLNAQKVTLLDVSKRSQDSVSGHDLVLTQRILGRSHNDTLGYVHSYIGFNKGAYVVYRTSISQQ